MERHEKLSAALELHTSAVERILSRGGSIPDSKWHEPIGEGKWSPAEIFAHLVSSYDVVTGELRGGAGMRIRTRFWQRWILRLTVAPRILAGKGFPRGAAAPRETRPGEALGREASLELMRHRADEFHAAALEAPPGRKITHAYFGSSPVADGVLLCSRHIEHHSGQLPDTGTS